MRTNYLLSSRLMLAAILALSLVIAAFSSGEISTTLAQSSSTSASTSEQIIPEALGTISGRVTDVDGLPLANVTVQLLRRDVEFSVFGIPVYEYVPAYTALTDSDGHYSVGALPTSIYQAHFSTPNRMYVGTIWDNREAEEPIYSAYNVQPTREIAVSGNEIDGIDVALQLGGTVAGILSVVDDLNAEQYTLSFYQVNEHGDYELVDSETFNIETIDIETGVYESKPVEVGTYRVCASASLTNAIGNSSSDVSECFDDHIIGIESALDVKVAQNVTTSDINFLLGESSQYASISGTVMGADGLPAANVQVDAYPAPHGFGVRQSATTDSLGRYLLDRLGPYGYYLNFLTAGTPYLSEYYNDATQRYESEEVRLEAGIETENINVELAIGGTITGRVLIQDSRVPTNGTVSVSQSGVINGFSAKTEVDPVTGDYKIQGLPTGEYRISARASEEVNGLPHNYYGGQLYDEQELVSVTAGTTVADVDFVLAEGLYEGRIQGTVQDDNGPLAGIKIELIDANVNEREVIFYTESDENGAYAIEGLGSAAYYLRFTDPTEQYSSQYNGGHKFLSDAPLISVRDGGVIQIDATMIPRGILRGQVLLADGAPAIDYSIQIVMVEGNEVSHSTAEYTINDYGFYTIDDLRPGSYRLMVLKPQISNGTPQSMAERRVYEEIILVESGTVAGAGEANVIQLSGPKSLPLVNEPQLAPSLFIPIAIQ